MPRHCSIFIYLGLVGAILSVDAGLAYAQRQASTRLTVRPSTMATGTTNPAAGEYEVLDSVKLFDDKVANAIVSVPPQCVGQRRCPLLIQLPGGGQSAQHMANWLHPVADRYGFLLLTMTDYDTASVVDTTMKVVLKKFAVDPGKIAIVGRCRSTAAALDYGIGNLDVFNRIGSISGSTYINGMDPNNKTAEFFIDEEFGGTDRDQFMAVQALRAGGHPVKQIMGFRSHSDQAEDYDFLGRWLQESWAKPDPATRTVPVVVTDSLPLLTSDILARMTAFWKSFVEEPDSIREAARLAHLREVAVPVASERPSIVMMDVPALAAQYPSVAAALARAGLTAKEHEAYRIAIVSAIVAGVVLQDQMGMPTDEWKAMRARLDSAQRSPDEIAQFYKRYAEPVEIIKVEATSTLGKNIKFLEAHPDELGPLNGMMGGTP